MTNPATTSLLDRANLDRDAVRHEIARGLSGADDGELFLEYSQTEALMFDNGRLKQATYDTAPGVWPARGEGRRGRLRAFLRRLAAGADPRRRRGRSGARRLFRHLRGAAAPYQCAALWRRQSARCPRLRDQGQAARRDRRLCPRQGPAGAAGHGQPRRDLAGGGDPAARRRELSRHPPAGAGQYFGGRRPRRPPGKRQQGLWRPRGLCALHRDQGLARGRRRRASARRWSISNRCRRRPAKWTWCWAPAGPA